MSLPLAATTETDVLVAGGGIAGVFAAFGAAEAGAEVTLIEHHGFLGGQGTAGGVHTFCGETQTVNAPWREMLERLSGFPNGIADYDANADGRAFDGEALKCVIDDMLAVRGVDVLLHSSVVAVEREDARVTGVVVHNKSGLTRVRPKMVVDATGDADIVAGGGWPYDKGGPALIRGDDGKIARVDSPGTFQLPMSLYFAMIDTDSEVNPARTALPAWLSDDELPMISVYEFPAYLLVKMKVISFDATEGRSISRAEQAARLQMYAVAHHLQTRGYRGRTYPRHKVAWAAPHIGVREGRRIHALRGLTLEDLLSGRMFSDAVAVGSYHIDYHWPTDVRRHGTGLTTQVPPYHIPLRAMRPVGSDNLLVPGRCMGGDQLAMSSYRVMGTCAQTGFGAGTAAAVTLAGGVSSLESVDIKEVQSVLRRKGVRLDLTPYTNYLRGRRACCEAVAAQAEGSISAVALVTLPDGTVLCAWTSASGDTSRVIVARRYRSQWRTNDIGRAPNAAVTSVKLTSDAPSRIFGFGSSYGSAEQDGVEDRVLPTVYLDVTTPTATESLRSTDGGVTWVADSAIARPAEGDSRQTCAVPYSGDLFFGAERPRVRLSGGAPTVLESSPDDGATWQARYELDNAASLGSGAGAIEAVPAGFAVAYVTAAGLVYRVLPYEAVFGDAPGAQQALENHVGNEWLVQFVSPGAHSEHPRMM